MPIKAKSTDQKVAEADVEEFREDLGTIRGRCGNDTHGYGVYECKSAQQSDNFCQ